MSAEDRGDGVLVIIPASMPSATVIDPLLDRLRGGLRHHNRVSADSAGIRLRVAIHSGQVHATNTVFTGTPLLTSSGYSTPAHSKTL